MEKTILFFIAFLLLCRSTSTAGINGMKKTKWYLPYNGDKTTFSNTQGKAGVYLIKKDSEIVYVGYSKNNVYRTMYRHFEVWNANQTVNTYDGKSGDYKCRVLLTTPAQAMKLETALIVKHQPRDNEKKLNNILSNVELNVLDKVTEAEEILPF